MTFEEKVYNAKIRFAWLGLEPDQTVTLQFGFEYEDGVVNTSRKLLHNTNEIKNILTTLEVNSWEELQRKFVRIKLIDKRVISVGNIMKNDWLNWER